MNSTDKTKTKEKTALTLQCSPARRPIQNTLEINIKNKNLKVAQSPERKDKGSNGNLLENITKGNNLTTISHGERNMVPRSISPIVNIGNFNNTTNSLKDGQNNASGNTNSNVSASPSHNNSEKASLLNNNDKNGKSPNNPLKSANKPATAQGTKKESGFAETTKKISNNPNSNSSSTTNSTNITPNQVKKPSTNIPIVIDLKNNQNPVKAIETDNKNKLTINTDKKFEKKNSNISEKDRKNLEEKKINTLSNNSNQNLNGKLSSEKLSTEPNRREGGQKKSTINKNDNKTKNITKKENTPTSSTSKEMESLMANKQSEFACCTISNPTEIQSKLTSYCEENNVVFKDVGNSKFECLKDGYTVGLEFTNAKGMKFLKIYLINGNEQSAKELMKAFLNLVL